MSESSEYRPDQEAVQSPLSSEPISSRRDFLKKTGALALGGAAVAFGLRGSQEASADGGDENKYLLAPKVEPTPASIEWEALTEAEKGDEILKSIDNFMHDDVEQVLDAADDLVSTRDIAASLKLDPPEIYPDARLALKGVQDRYYLKNTADEEHPAHRSLGVVTVSSNIPNSEEVTDMTTFGMYMDVVPLGYTNHRVMTDKGWITAQVGYSGVINGSRRILTELKGFIADDPGVPSKISSIIHDEAGKFRDPSHYFEDPSIADVYIEGVNYQADLNALADARASSVLTLLVGQTINIDVHGTAQVGIANNFPQDLFSEEAFLRFSENHEKLYNGLVRDNLKYADTKGDYNLTVLPASAQNLTDAYGVGIPDVFPDIKDEANDIHLPSYKNFLGKDELSVEDLLSLPFTAVKRTTAGFSPDSGLTL